MSVPVALLIPSVVGWVYQVPVHHVDLHRLFGA